MRKAFLVKNSVLGSGMCYHSGKDYLFRKWKQKCSIGEVEVDVFMDETRGDEKNIRCTLIDKDNVIPAFLAAKELNLDDADLYVTIQLHGKLIIFEDFQMEEVRNGYVRRFQSSFQTIEKTLAKLLHRAKQTEIIMSIGTTFQKRTERTATDENGIFEGPPLEAVVKQEQQSPSERVFAIKELRERILTYSVVSQPPEKSAILAAVNRSWRSTTSSLYATFGFHLFSPDMLVNYLERFTEKLGETPINGLPITIVFREKSELDNAAILLSMQSMNLNLVSLIIDCAVLTKKNVELLSSMLLPRLKGIKINDINPTVASIKLVNKTLKCFNEIISLELLMPKRNHGPHVLENYWKSNGMFIYLPSKLKILTFAAEDESNLILLKQIPTGMFPRVSQFSLTLGFTDEQNLSVAEEPLQAIMQMIASSVKHVKINKLCWYDENGISIHLPTMQNLRILCFKCLNVTTAGNLPELNNVMLSGKFGDTINAIFPIESKHLNVRNLVLAPCFVLTSAQMDRIANSMPYCTSLHVTIEEEEGIGGDENSYPYFRSICKSMSHLQTLCVLFYSRPNKLPNTTNYLGPFLTGETQEKLTELANIANPNMWEEIELGTVSLTNLNRLQRLLIARLDPKEPSIAGIDELLFRLVFSRMRSLESISLYHFAQTNVEIVQALNDMGIELHEDIPNSPEDILNFR